MSVDYRKACYELWRIIDDIDTISDMVKFDDVAYRRLVEKRQADRWKVLSENDVATLYADYYPKESSLQQRNAE